MKPERIVGWVLFLGGGFAPVVVRIAGAQLGEVLATISATLLVAGGLVLYAGDGMAFARRDPVGFGSIAIPALSLPAVGLAAGQYLVGSILGIALVLAFLVMGKRTWPIWKRFVLRRPAISRERKFERAALSDIRAIINRLVGAVDDPQGCAAHLQVARRDVLDLAALAAPNSDWAAVRDGYVQRLGVLLDQSHDAGSLKRALKAWAADPQVKALRDRFDDLAGAPRRAAERAAQVTLRDAD